MAPDADRGSAVGVIRGGELSMAAKEADSLFGRALLALLEMSNDDERSAGSMGTSAWLIDVVVVTTSTDAFLLMPVTLGLGYCESSMAAAALSLPPFPSPSADDADRAADERRSSAFIVVCVRVCVLSSLLCHCRHIWIGVGVWKSDKLPCPASPSPSAPVFVVVVAVSRSSASHHHPIKHSRAMAEYEGRTKVVFVGNLPYDATEQEVQKVFEVAGPVVSFRHVFDRDSNKAKGFGEGDCSMVWITPHRN